MRSQAAEHDGEQHEADQLRPRRHRAGPAARTVNTVATAAGSGAASAPVDDVDRQRPRPAPRRARTARPAPGSPKPALDVAPTTTSGSGSVGTQATVAKTDQWPAVDSERWAIRSLPRRRCHQSSGSLDRARGPAPRPRRRDATARRSRRPPHHAGRPWVIAASVPAMGDPGPVARRWSVPGEVGGADQAGAVAEPGPADLEHRPVPATGQLGRERRPAPGRAAARPRRSRRRRPRPRPGRARRSARRCPRRASGRATPAARWRTVSPARAASVTSGPVIASTSPPARSSRSAASSEPARAAARASRTSAEPLAYISKQPRLPQPHRMPSGHHAHVPDLGAHAEGAAVERAVEDDAAADAGADGDQQEVVDVVAGAELELAPGRGVRVVLDDDGQAERRLEVGLQVEVAPGQVGGEQHDGAGLVDVAGRAHADRLDRGGGSRSSVTSFSIAASMACDVGGRRLDPELLEDGAVLVDDAAGDLGAADVDAAGQAHDCVIASSSRRPSRRRGRSARRRSPRAGVGGAIIPETASISDDAALARWARTSGLVCRIAATVRQTGHHAHSGDPVARCSWRSAVGERHDERRRRARVAQPERAPKSFAASSATLPTGSRAVVSRSRVRPPLGMSRPRFAPRRTSPAARPRPRGRRRPDGGPARRAG